MKILDSQPLIIAPMPTPFRPNGSVDYGAIAHNIDQWLLTPLSGFVLGSVGGEEMALSDDEKKEIVIAANAARDESRLIIAGIDVSSSIETLRLSENYACIGADMVRVRIPRGLSLHQVSDYFEEVANESPIPVIVIHQMFGSSPGAAPEIIGHVCSHPNVFAYITDHDIRFEGWVRPFVPKNCRFMICNGGLLAYGALLGADGACMWLGNIAPKLCNDIISAGLVGEFKRARDLQETASMLDYRIGRFGVAGVKAALSELGYTMSGPRAPIGDISKADRANIKEALFDAEILV